MLTFILSKFKQSLSDFSQRPNFDLNVLISCAFVLGIAYGLSRGHFLLDVPPWYSLRLQRFCVVLMIWTALTQTTAERVIGWTITDALALSSPTIFGTWLPELASMDIGPFILYQLNLGAWVAGVTTGIAITQACISIFPALLAIKRFKANP